MNFPFLKKETFGLRTQETFIGNKCEIYIPSYYFNKSKPEIAIAKELGERIQTMGLFWFNVDGSWYEMQLPLKFEFQFSETDKRTLKIKPEFPEETYDVFILKRNDAFVYDILHKKDLDDLKKDFIGKMVENAKLPSTIAYSDSINIFLKAMQATEFTGLGVSAVSIEFMLAEMYRNRKNMRQPFRMAYNGKNDYNYKMVRIIKLPELNSTFTSLIGEDVNNQLISSILRKREGAVERESPIEKIIKY